MIKKIIFIIIALFLIIFLIGIFFAKKTNTVEIKTNESQPNSQSMLSSTLTTELIPETSSIPEVNSPTATITASLNSTSTNKPQATNSTKESNASTLDFTLKFQEKINQDVANLTKNLKPDENKSISQYQNEIQKVQLKLLPFIAKQNIDPQTLINVAKDLASIKPPPLFYSFHLELIKTYYTLGLALKESQQTNDPIKKALLYNLINSTLEKIKP